jgi:hypothetical protein
MEVAVVRNQLTEPKDPVPRPVPALPVNRPGDPTNPLTRYGQANRGPRFIQALNYSVMTPALLSPT